jgi:hypothetical protein
MLRLFVQIQLNVTFLRHIYRIYHFICIVKIKHTLKIDSNDVYFSAQLSLPCLSDDELKLYNTTQQPSQCLLPESPSVEAGELSIFYISLILISIFVLEILAAFYAFGWRRYTKLLYLFDAIIVLVSFILEVYFHFGNVGKVGPAVTGLVVLRLWKIIRAIHAIAHSMALRNHMIVTEIEQAQALLNVEKLQAEKTIHEQQMTIQDLTNRLEKNDKQITPEQNNEFPLSRDKSLECVTSF